MRTDLDTTCGQRANVLEQDRSACGLRLYFDRTAALFPHRLFTQSLLETSGAARFGGGDPAMGRCTALLAAVDHDAAGVRVGLSRLPPSSPITSLSFLDLAPATRQPLSCAITFGLQAFPLLGQFLVLSPTHLTGHRVGRVPELDRAVFHQDGMGGEAVEEITVVRNDHAHAREPFQLADQALTCFRVEMVGRLVDTEDVGSSGQCAGQLPTATLSRRQCVPASEIDRF